MRSKARRTYGDFFLINFFFSICELAYKMLRYKETVENGGGSPGNLRKEEKVPRTSS